MDLQINGHIQHFEPLKSFCATYDLPSEFGMETFLFKDYTALGSIEKAQAHLASVHHTVVAAVPSQCPSEGWLAFSIKLQRLFLNQLRAVNTHIGLKESEITYAVSGCADACQAVIHEASKAHMIGRELPSFSEVYAKWLHNTVEISHKVYFYIHQDVTWQIRIVKHIYGRVGLIIDTPHKTHYVYDARLACPAEGFMYSLLRDVANKILDSYRQRPK